MNKLYILGALLLSSAEAWKITNYATVTDAKTYGAALPFGGFTYTVSGDCFSAGTATTLGMNNKYYQYYTYDIAAGTKTFAAASPASSATANPAHTYAYNACSHTHLYNWMATPVMGTSAVTSGLGTAVVAYGYVLTGTAVTTCVNAIATGTLYSSTAKTFSGAAYQSVSVLYQLNSNDATTIAQNVRVKVGNENWDAVAVKTGASISTFSKGITDGVDTKGSSNAYWDFMQTNIFQGMTQFGRGGGASTSPCGWYVVYAHEQPGPSTIVATVTTVASGLAQGTEDLYITPSKATIHMWTDNSIVTVASSIVFSALATILF